MARSPAILERLVLRAHMGAKLTVELVPTLNAICATARASPVEWRRAR